MNYISVTEQSIRAMTTAYQQLDSERRYNHREVHIYNESSYNNKVTNWS